MTERTPKSEPPPAPSKTARAPASSRAGFVTMPTELRVFSRPDPTARSLADNPEVAAAAAKLRTSGRGPDVLYEDLRDAGPQKAGDPSANDNRAEHLIVEMPAGVPGALRTETERATPAGDEGASPWAHDAAAANELAAAAIDKDALPSATAPSSGQPPSVREARGPASLTRPSARPRDASSKRGRAWMAMGAAGLVTVVVMVLITTSPPADDGSGRSPTASNTGAMGTSAMTGAAARTGDEVPTAMPSGLAVNATGAAASTTGAAPMTTGAAALAPTSSAKVAPRSTGDPYLDAGVLPKATATVDPAPSVAPVVTAVPSIEPSGAPATTTSRPIAPFGVHKD